MISKKSRQGRIASIVERRAVSSQEQLAELLAEEGVRVTQSTLSRDIREVGLIKVRGLYGMAAQPVAPSDEAMRRLLQQLVVRSDVSGNIMVVKTSPGNAHPLGAVLDAIQWPEVLGTVAGDDTVFVLLRNSRLGYKVRKRLEELCA
jgi:transcriptional regulator of arginine metabolism